MTNGPYKPVTKPLGVRLLELIQALQVVRDSLQAASQGKPHQLIPLAGQLRSLLTEKSKQNEPLLLTLAELTNQSLQVFCSPDPDFSQSIALLGSEGHEMRAPDVSLRQIHDDQLPVDIPTLLNRKVLRVGARQYTIRHLIEFLANKAGGSHYSPDWPPDFAELMGIGMFGQRLPFHLLAQIGGVIYELGLDLLRRLCAFEIHLLIAIARQSVSEPRSLIHALYPGTRMKLALSIGPEMRLRFELQGLAGSELQLYSGPLIDWSRPRHVSLRHEFDEELRSVASVHVDGQEKGRRRVEEPIFVVADLPSYDLYVNRQPSGAETGLTWGMASLFMLGPDPHAIGVARVIIDFAERANDLNTECARFQQGVYGHAPPGTTTLGMTGEVNMVSFRELLATE